MMHQYTFIACNTCTILVENLDNGAGSECEEQGSMCSAPLTSPQFCRESKTAQRNKIYYEKSREGELSGKGLEGSFCGISNILLELGMFTLCKSIKLYAHKKFPIITEKGNIFLF